MHEVISARIAPVSQMTTLSQTEVTHLRDTSQSGLYTLFRNCALAVLNSGIELDDGKVLLERFSSFDIQLVQQERGLKLQLDNAPAHAFVDGEIIKGINEQLFAVLRDIVYVRDEVIDNPRLDLNTSGGITNAVFHILRNAEVFHINTVPNLIVCWGGHSIRRREYEYTKEVGYEMGLRDLNICTGCGPGAMKGPMKGATIAHAKQRIPDRRYIGITEPGIIAAESPNPIVNELVILPDIEKRLEAFIRTGHGIVVFPGGAGTAEEILYLLGVLLHPENDDIPFPLVFTGPVGSHEYFEQIDDFIVNTLGEKAQQRYEIVINNPAKVARIMKEGMQRVYDYRLQKHDAFYYNWLLHIDDEFQQPFLPTHENMRDLALNHDQPVHMLAANLRRAFSGVVAGNVKDDGIRSIEQYGHFELSGDADIMSHMDDLLSAFVKQQRMKLPGTDYVPCYKIIK